MVGTHTNTGRKDDKGRTIWRGPRGGEYVKIGDKRAKPAIARGKRAKSPARSKTPARKSPARSKSPTRPESAARKSPTPRRTSGRKYASAPARLETRPYRPARKSPVKPSKPAKPPKQTMSLDCILVALHKKELSKMDVKDDGLDYVEDIERIFASWKRVRRQDMTYFSKVINGYEITFRFEIDDEISEDEYRFEWMRVKDYTDKVVVELSPPRNEGFMMFNPDYVSEKTMKYFAKAYYPRIELYTSRLFDHIA